MLPLPRGHCDGEKRLGMGERTAERWRKAVAQVGNHPVRARHLSTAFPLPGRSLPRQAKPTPSRINSEGSGVEVMRPHSVYTDPSLGSRCRSQKGWKS